MDGLVTYIPVSYTHLDVYKRQVLTGGGALLNGLEELIEEKTGISTMTAEDPMSAVAIGTGKYIEFLNNPGADSNE